MSNLSGYDSEVTGFDSIATNKNESKCSSTQTTEFNESGTGCQTNMTKSSGCNVTPQDLNSESNILKDYPEGLNEFLRKVIPGMLEQLDENSRDNANESSDSEDEEVLPAKMFQELNVTQTSGSGDNDVSILSMSWSSAGNSIAISTGKLYHENWCEHEGLIRVYTSKHSEDDKYVHSFDINENNCITVVKYHPSLAALLAYGTTSGEVVICNLSKLTSGCHEPGTQLTSPQGTHSSINVTAMQWADAHLANTFLVMHILDTGKRRGAADQVLITAGCDGTINVWLVNVNTQIFQSIISYKINGTKKNEPAITCFDFIKTFPLKPVDEKVPENIFVVGTNSGQLFLCHIHEFAALPDCGAVDPVFQVLEGHDVSVVDAVFSGSKPGILLSMSIDSELRIYEVGQMAPLKVICIDEPLSCISWLPNNPCLVLLGLAKVGKRGDLIKVYDLSNRKPLPMDIMRVGDDTTVSVTTIAVNYKGTCRIAVGDTHSKVYIWDMPTMRIKYGSNFLEF